MDEAAISSSFRQKWAELQKLLERQRSKGGIIDPEAESNRFLIHINDEVRAAPPSWQPDPERSSLDPDAARLPQTAAENGSPGSDGPPAPTGPSDQDQAAPGLSHCRGSQARRHHRRGGRARPQFRRGPPIPEQLDQLRLSSGPAEQPEKAGAQGGHVQPRRAEAGLCPSKPDGGLSAEQQESPAALSPDSPGGAADSRGHRERRRGSRRPVSNSGAPGPPHRWDTKGSRNRGGHGREGGGHRRGHSRGFPHKVVDRERGREEVL